MKLFYYQRRDGLGNFGDQLNPWLWHQLLPGFFDRDETVVFVGIGTLLNNLLVQRLSKAQKLIIFSTGVGYEKKLVSISDNWQICCVRGFLSARQLGLSEELAVTDGAILVRRLFQPTGEKLSSFGFMPHIHHTKFAGTAWQEICSQIGFLYIDPSWPVEKVLSAISQTEVLIAEAMHGAIVADALRIPWIPVITSTRILEFKWHDWCSSIGLVYRPHYLIPLPEFYPRFARGVRSSLKAFQYWGKCWQNSHLNYLSLLDRDKQQWYVSQLLHIAKTGCPNLSADRDIERLTMELESRLCQITNV